MTLCIQESQTNETAEQFTVCSWRERICLINDNSGTQLRCCIHRRPHREVIRKKHFIRELFWIQGSDNNCLLMNTE